MGPKDSKLAAGWKRWTQSKGPWGNTDISELRISNWKPGLSLTQISIWTMGSESFTMQWYPIWLRVWRTWMMWFSRKWGHFSPGCCSLATRGASRAVAICRTAAACGSDKLSCSRSSSSFCLQRIHTKELLRCLKFHSYMDFLPSWWREPPLYPFSKYG